MLGLRHKILNRVLRFTDLSVIAITFLFLPETASITVADRAAGVASAMIPADAAAVIVLALGWFLILDQTLRYTEDRAETLRTQILRAVRACVYCSILLALVRWTAGSRDAHGTILFFGITSAAICSSRIATLAGLKWSRIGSSARRNLLIVGTGPAAQRFAQRVDARPELGCRIAGYVSIQEDSDQREDADQNASPGRKRRVIGTARELRRILMHEQIDEIAVCCPVDQIAGGFSSLVRDAATLGIVVRIVPEGRAPELFRNLQVEQLGDECIVTLFRERMIGQLFLKRTIDVTLALAGILLLSPLLASVALAVKLTSRGPVLFVQQRVGLHQRTFRLLKFRSMVADAEERKRGLAHLNEHEGPVFKIRDDPRVTPLGRWLRRTSIDELPQLWNVLAGDMSLVGPRPPLPEEVDEYDWAFHRRLSVKPGLTCIWQVSGRNGIPFGQWMTMDDEYVENWSLWLDLRILLKTVPAVLSSRGAS